MVHRPSAWLAADSGEIAVSSRVRLARDLDGMPFPGWAGEAECVEIWRKLVPVLKETSALANGVLIDMGEADEVDKEVLRERHLISTELADKSKGSGLLVNATETLAVMINEEDHLRIQAMRPGMDVRTLWKEVDAIDSEIEAKVRYAFSPRLGYLTACPTNIGTGLRASIMLHLPGLRLINEIDAVTRGLNKVGLAVRGLLGEGTEAMGNMYQVSNQTTLGETEETVVTRLVQIVNEVIEHERNARIRLIEKK